MIELPQDIEFVLLGLLGLHDTDDPRLLDQTRLRSLSTQLFKLSNDFRLSRQEKNPHHDAYLAYHFPMNFMKAWMITRWLQHRHPRCFAAKKDIQVLDIGCGHGAAMFGIYDALKKNRRISLTGIDRSATALRVCRKIARALQEGDRRLRTRVQRHRLEHSFLVRTKKKFDVVIIANALAEIEQDEDIPRRYITQIFRYVVPGGIVIIIEPATRMLSRRLMRMRDSLLQGTAYHVLLPCLHESMCPLLGVRKGKEWCHQARWWQPPHYIQQINKPLHREIDRLKFSYLVLSKTPYRDPAGSDFLVVSDLLKEKGRQKCYLCTPTGRVELVRPAASQDAGNEDFDRITRGDIITLGPVAHVRKDAWRIEPSSPVTIKPGTT